MTSVDVRPFQFLYVSDSSPGIDHDMVVAIGIVSTRRNLASGISGALLFDGRRFCQLLEGPERDVRSLMTAIEVDPRHRGIAVAAASHFGLPRLTTHWRLGCCSADAMEPLRATPLPHGEVALALFMSALAFSTPPTAQTPGTRRIDLDDAAPTADQAW